MPSPPGSSCIGNRSFLQAHLALEKTSSGEQLRISAMLLISRRVITQGVMVRTCLLDCGDQPVRSLDCPQRFPLVHCFGEVHMNFGDAEPVRQKVQISLFKLPDQRPSCYCCQTAAAEFEVDVWYEDQDLDKDEPSHELLCRACVFSDLEEWAKPASSGNDAVNLVAQASS